MFSGIGRVRHSSEFTGNVVHNQTSFPKGSSTCLTRWARTLSIGRPIIGPGTVAAQATSSLRPSWVRASTSSVPRNRWWRSRPGCRRRRSAERRLPRSMRSKGGNLPGTQVRNLDEVLAGSASARGSQRSSASGSAVSLTAEARFRALRHWQRRNAPTRLRERLLGSRPGAPEGTSRAAAGRRSSASSS